MRGRSVTWMPKWLKAAAAVVMVAPPGRGVEDGGANDARGFEANTAPTRADSASSRREGGRRVAVEAHVDSSPDLERAAGIHLHPEARAIVQRHVAVDDVAEERDLGDRP